jgi:DDE superfamily endonuclease
MDDLNEQDQAYFTASSNGWTNNELGLAWLRRFDQDTQYKGNRRRLLIVDGHLSHLNMAFLKLADSLRILILILPPYTTYRLQSLDVSLFGPLAKAYTKRLDAYTHKGLE